MNFLSLIDSSGDATAKVCICVYLRGADKMIVFNPQHTKIRTVCVDERWRIGKQKQTMRLIPIKTV